MLRFVVIILALAAASPVRAVDCGADISLETLLKRNLADAGGEAAWQSLDNVRYRLTIAEPDFEVEATYWATREGDARIDIYAGDQRVFAEGLNDGDGWQWQPERGVFGMSSEGEAAMRHGTELPGRFFTLTDLHHWEGAEVSLAGCGEIDGVPRCQVTVTLDDGFSTHYFLDPANGRTVAQRARRALHPDVDPSETTIETRYELFDVLVPVLQSRRSVQVNGETGEWMATTTVLRVDYNIELPRRLFEAGYVPPR